MRMSTQHIYVHRRHDKRATKTWVGEIELRFVRNLEGGGGGGNEELLSTVQVSKLALTRKSVSNPERDLWRCQRTKIQICEEGATSLCF